MTREIVSRLLDRHEVVCMGHEADVAVWGGKKELHMPGGKVLNTLVMPNPMVNQGIAGQIVDQYSAKYGLELLIGHWDAFALSFLRNVKLPFVLYVPIDAELTPTWADEMKGARRLILYSKFGYGQARRFFPASTTGYIPHGVDTETFRPLDRSAADLREQVSETANRPIPRDAFMFTCTAANVGERKNLPLLIRTFAKFKEKHGDSCLYLHTNSASTGQGYDLSTVARGFGVQGSVFFPKYNPIMEPASDEEFCRLYNASDAFVSASSGEGFMLPLLESQSCGLPAVVPLNSAQTELVRGHGWLYDCVPSEAYVNYPAYVPTMQFYAVPDQRALFAAMEQAYGARGDPKPRLEARRFALQYDWDRVMPGWFRVLDELAEEEALEKDMKGALGSV